MTLAPTTSCNCSVADDLQTNVVIGCGKAIENMADLGKFLEDSRRKMAGR